MLTVYYDVYRMSDLAMAIYLKRVDRKQCEIAAHGVRALTWVFFSFLVCVRIRWSIWCVPFTLKAVQSDLIMGELWRGPQGACMLTGSPAAGGAHSQRDYQARGACGGNCAAHTEAGRSVPYGQGPPLCCKCSERSVPRSLVPGGVHPLMLHSVTTPNIAPLAHVCWV